MVFGVGGIQMVHGPGGQVHGLPWNRDEKSWLVLPCNNNGRLSC